MQAADDSTVAPETGARPLDAADDAMQSRIGERLRDLALSLIAVLLGLCTIVFHPAQAAQTLDIRDGDTTVVRISIRDQTRLRADRGRLLDVIGDVYDAQKNPAGRLVVLKDEADGEFYVKPVLLSQPGAPMLPVKLDIKTDRGTVGLLLQPADVVGDTLTLRVSGGEGRAAAEGPKAKGAAHVRAIKALTLAMAAPGLAGELPPQRMPAGGELVSLWQEARFVMVAKYEAPGLVGEAYELTNVSRERMVIDERELYRGGVLSVSVRQLSLAPGEATPVWIVRQARERE